MSYIKDSTTLNDGRIISVGTSGLILISYNNGETWSSSSSGVNTDLNGISSNSNGSIDAIVAVGNNGVILTSVNGVIWEQHNPAAGLESINFNGVAYALGVFLLVGNGGTFALSATDGHTWVSIPLDNNEDLFDISVGTDFYTIVGDDNLVLVGSLLGISVDKYLNNFVFTEDSCQNTGSFQENIIEEMELVTSNDGEYYAYISELFTSIDFPGDLQGIFNPLINEISLFFYNGVGNKNGFANLSNSISLGDTSAFSIGISTIENISLTTIKNLQGFFDIYSLEEVSMSSILFSKQYANMYVTQKLNTFDSIFISYIDILIESISLSDEQNVLLRKIADLIEKIQIDHDSSLHATYYENLVNALSLNHIVQLAQGVYVDETTNINNILESLMTYYSLLVEDIVISTIENMSFVICSHISETISQSATSFSNTIFDGIISENIAFSVLFNIDNDLYTGWAMNTKYFAVSKYSNYPFNSFAKIGGKYYGANENGLYLLEGDTDAGANIEAYASMGLTNFGEPRTKRMRAAYVGVRSDGRTLLKVKTDNNETKYYEIGESKNGLSSKKVPMQRNMVSTYWHFTLENVNGSDFELDSFEFIPVVLNRRG